MQGYMTIIRNYARIAAPVLLILLGFSIPISVVSDNILLGPILLCWVMSGEWTQKWLAMWRNPIARAGFLRFVFLALGAFYGKASFGEAGDMLFKLKRFLLRGLFAGLIPDAPRDRSRMLDTFLWATDLTRLLTCHGIARRDLCT